MLSAAPQCRWSRPTAGISLSVRTGVTRTTSELARPFFHSRGVAVLSYINPLVGEEYAGAFDTAERAGALQRRESRQPYLFQAYVGGRVPPHTSETQYDFRSPRPRDCWGEILERIVSAGYDGWMEDFGEYTPVASAAGNSTVSGLGRHEAR
jgi:alpha-glucosidase (family GH31 glycosyl hydrolase)